MTQGSFHLILIYFSEISFGSYFICKEPIYYIQDEDIMYHYIILYPQDIKDQHVFSNCKVNEVN